METDKATLPINFDQLYFRRQFILGPESYSPDEYWEGYNLAHDLKLSVHQDLPCYSKEKDGVTLAILGILIDPFHPARDEAEILEDVLKKGPAFADVLDYSRRLSGRWVIIYQDKQSTFIFTDPCAFRQVYYCRDEGNIWCASQPALIKKKIDLVPRKDQDLLEFITSPAYSQRESAWLGDKTRYKQCLHLLPNHYLDLSEATSRRFYPEHRKEKDKELSEVVDTACRILQGTIEGLLHKTDVMMALTAGWDSRLLLAASRGMTHDIVFHMDRKGTVLQGDPDVWVPEMLAGDLGISFHVQDSSREAPDWFVALLSQNVGGAQIQNKTKSIYSKLISGEHRLNINGNGSEISRNSSYHKKITGFSEINPETLVRISGYDAAPGFAVKEIKKWKKGIDDYLNNDLSILDLFYWEQRMGNWGAQYPAEQDIAIEEVSPFNNRLFIEHLFSVPQEMRVSPEVPIYREFINEMWPEVMDQPINPIPKYHKNMMDAVRKEIPKERIYGKLKSLLNINPYKRKS